MYKELMESRRSDDEAWRDLEPGPSQPGKIGSFSTGSLLMERGFCVQCKHVLTHAHTPEMSQTQGSGENVLHRLWHLRSVRHYVCLLALMGSIKV
jgi:hypothetical protein